MLKILLFCIIYMISMDVLSRIIAKVRGYEPGLTNAFKNSIMFNNTGNIGVSLIILVFTNLTMNTLGFFFAGRAQMKTSDTIKKILAMPTIYVVCLAVLFKYIHFQVETTPFWSAIVYIKEGLVAMSLLTLGVQLSKTIFDFSNLDSHIAVVSRLILGPVFAVILMHLLGFSRIVAQVLLITYSVPTAVNTALIAVEFDNHPDFASQVVVVSTIFSAQHLPLLFLWRELFSRFSSGKMNSLRKG